MRPHPHLYEINTWPWLDGLSRRYGRHLTLGSVPNEQWDALRASGIDLVFLMGIWRRSPLGRQLARADPRCFPPYDQALPGWRVQDVVGSAYSIVGYDPDPRIGTLGELDLVRDKLHARDMQLIVDFIPNHVGFDHPWIGAHPDRFVTGSEDAFRRDPSAFRPVELGSGEVRFIACGRDPCFPPWADVAQLDYFNPDTRAAMLAELGVVARHADGARCDMALLVLSEVFERTWGELVKTEPPATEFWAEAVAAVPGFVLLGEVYWGLEWRLQQLGFDFTYDKRLYDRLLNEPAESVRRHLRADPEYQRRSARFIENHDEPRSAVAFGSRAISAAVVMSTLPGLRFYYDGQFEGRRIRLPVQLGVEPSEPTDDRLSAFYRRLLATVDTPVFHSGLWRLCEVRPCNEGNDTSTSLAAWSWRRGDDDVRIVSVNLGPTVSQGSVDVIGALPVDGDLFVFEDLLDGNQYRWNRGQLADRGLYVRLTQGQAHIFSVRRQ